VGFLDDVKKLELADDLKEKLIQAHQSEIDPYKEQNDKLQAKTKQDSVKREVDDLKALFGEDSVSLLKFCRRVFLSADAEEPGAVLLSDADLELAGDDATGASGREDISVAGALRKFIELMPRTDEGKLKVQLSEQVEESLAGSNRPDGDNEEDVSVKASRLAGRPVKRSGKRYAGFSAVAE
jgi:hypothetical protein